MGEIAELDGVKNRFAKQALDDALADLVADAGYDCAVIVLSGPDRYVRFHRGGCSQREAIGLLHYGIDAAMRGTSDG